MSKEPWPAPQNQEYPISNRNSSARRAASVVRMSGRTLDSYARKSTAYAAKATMALRDAIRLMEIKACSGATFPMR